MEEVNANSFKDAAKALELVLLDSRPLELHLKPYRMLLYYDICSMVQGQI